MFPIANRIVLTWTHDDPRPINDIEVETNEIGFGTFPQLHLFTIYTKIGSLVKMGNQASHHREPETLDSAESDVRSLTYDLDRLQITEVIELFKEGQYGRKLKRHDFDKIAKLTHGKLD